MNSVYVLVDPRTSEAKYVGCTQDPKARLSGHIKSYKGRTNAAKWVAELRAVGHKPELIVLEHGLNHSKGRESEAFWTEYLRSLGATLLNMKDPGDRGVSLVEPPSAWHRHYGVSRGNTIYQQLVANSQPF